MASPSPTPATEKQNPTSVSSDLPCQDLDAGDSKLWLPFVLEPPIVGLLIFVLFGGAIGLEVALRAVKKSKGWETKAGEIKAVFAHYEYTLPPVVVAIVVVAAWSAMAHEILKLQPYVDLARGNASAKKTVMLDYTSYAKLLVWFPTIKNKHYIAALSVIVSLLMLLVQPLASALFFARDTSFVLQESLRSFGTIGLDPGFETLTPFVTAAGYAEASTLYALENPPFVLGSWTIGEFEIPQSFGAINATIVTDTTAVRTDAGCEPADSTNFVRVTSGWELTGTWNDCTATFNISTTATTQYGVHTVDSCTSALRDLPPATKPVVFWMFSAAPDYSSARSSIAFCQPSLGAYNVRATVNARTKALLNVTLLDNYTLVNNVTTGLPLNGRPFNGIEYNITTPDVFLIARANATQSGLPGAIYQAAAKNPGGLDAVYTTDGAFVNLTTQVYSLFLASVAKQVYFLKTEAPSRLAVEVRYIQRRLWMSVLATHFLAAVLIVSGIAGTIIHVQHYRARRDVKLFLEPGTIAAAVSLTSHSNIATVLQESGRTPDKIDAALRNRKFRIDERGRVIMDSDEGQVGRS